LPLILELSPAALSELPIFPLGQLVLFPHAYAALHIFEHRYRAMLKRCMDSHRTFAIASVPDPSDVDEHHNPKLSAIAGIGVIVECEMLADGRANIVVQGRARARLEELPFVLPFRRAKATVLPDVDEAIPEAERATLLSITSQFIRAVRVQEKDFEFELPPEGSLDAWVDLCSHYLMIRADVKQELLEQSSPRKRFERVIRELSAQTLAMSSAQGSSLN
jgi:uncharacterized protein